MSDEKKRNRSLFVVVDEKASREVPYPFVLILNDGTVRELNEHERRWLETPFEGGDGGRPFIKLTWEESSPSGRPGGFVRRKLVPDGIAIGPPGPTPMLADRLGQKKPPSPKKRW